LAEHLFGLIFFFIPNSLQKNTLTKQEGRGRRGILAKILGKFYRAGNYRAVKLKCYMLRITLHRVCSIEEGRGQCECLSSQEVTKTIRMGAVCIKLTDSRRAEVKYGV
jgi:hypothetical protein